jgi:hypothetical protein
MPGRSLQTLLNRQILQFFIFIPHKLQRAAALLNDEDEPIIAALRPASIHLQRRNVRHGRTLGLVLEVDNPA